MGDGAAALRALIEADYDAVLMVCQMPVMDGYTAIRQPRQAEEENGRPHVPVVALTASAMVEDRLRCLDAGMDDYVSKRPEPDTLADTLDRWTAISGTPARHTPGQDTTGQDTTGQDTTGRADGAGEPAVSPPGLRDLAQAHGERCGQRSGGR